MEHGDRSQFSGKTPKISNSITLRLRKAHCSSVIFIPAHTFQYYTLYEVDGWCLFDVWVYFCIFKVTSYSFLSRRVKRKEKPCKTNFWSAFSCWAALYCPKKETNCRWHPSFKSDTTESKILTLEIFTLENRKVSIQNKKKVFAKPKRDSQKPKMHSL